MSPQSPADASPHKTLGASRPVRLRRYLARVIWLALGPLAILAAALSVQGVMEVRRGIDAEARQLADTLRDAVDRSLRLRMRGLEMLALSRAFDGGDPAQWLELYDEALAYRESFGTHLVLADAQMQMLFNTRVPRGTALPRLPVPAGRAAAPLALSSGRPAVGDLFFGPVAREPLVALAVPVVRQGSSIALWIAAFEAQTFEQHLGEAKLPPGWAIELRDGAGGVIASRGATEGRRDADAAVRVQAASSHGPWTAAVWIPQAVYLQPVWKAVAVLGGALLLALAGGLAAGFTAARRLATDMATLVQPTGSRGAPGRRAGIAEVDRVRSRLDEAERQRAEGEAVLRRSERAYRLLFDRHPHPMWVFDPATLRFLAVNDAALAQYGHSREAFLGMTLLDIRPPDEHERLRRAIADTSGGLAQSPQPMGRWIHVAQAGHRIDVDLTWSDIEFEGAPARMALAVDVTEQARLERERAAALERALASAHALQETLGRIGDAFVSLDRDWRFTYVNGAARRMLQLGDGSEAIGRSVEEVFPGAQSHAWFQDAQDALASGSPAVHERYYAPLNMWFESRFYPGSDGLSIYFTDISARRRAEAAVREREERLRIFIEQAPVALAMFDREMRYLAVSGRWRSDYGLGDRVLAGCSHYEIFPEIGEDWKAVHRRGLAGEVVSRDRDRFERDDGSVQWLHWEVQPWYESTDRVGGILIFTQDVTQNMDDQRALRESERDFRLLAEQIPAIVYRARLDPPGHVDYVSPRIAELGFTPEQWLAQPQRVWDTMHPDDRERVRSELAAGFSGPGDEMHFEYRMRNAQAGWRWSSDFARVVRPEGGAPFVLGVNVDVTRVREAEAALRRREQQFRTLAEQLPAIVYRASVEHDSQAFYVSPHIATLGYTPAQWTSLQGPNWLQCLHPDDRGRVLSRVAELPESGGAFTLEYRLRDSAGQWHHFTDHGRMIEGEGGEPAQLQGVMVEISELKRSEQALRDAQAYQRSVFEALADGVLLLDARHHVLDANPAASAMLGYPRDELLQLQLQDLLTEPDRARVDESIGAAWHAPGMPLLQWDHRRRDGSVFPAEVSARALGDGRFVTVVRDISQRREAERAMLGYQMDLSELTHRLLTQERESSRRLAQTLHDHLGQSLTVARLHLDATLGSRDVALAPTLKSACERLGGLIGDAMAEVRQVLGELRPPMLEEQGLVAALDNEIRTRTVEQADVDVLLEVDAEVLPLRWPADVQYAAFMVAREAIVNAQQHAQASLVRVVVEGDARSLTLEVIDDGRGVDEAVRAGRPGHLGLVGMRERALAIGAQFSVGTDGGEGTCVRLHWEARS